MMESEAKGLVCVTGGTGYVASWLIMRLLQQGYTVRTTLRSHRGQRDVSFLTSLPGATEKLHFFHADLNEPDSFGAAIEGCTGVFHVAYPLGNIKEIPEDELTKMNVEGTLGILKLCAESKTVKRVVYTSGAATVVYNGERREVVDENTWSDIDFSRSLKTGVEAHVATKTKTEKAAWDFAEKHGLDLVTVIPTLVVGPFICHNLPVSVRFGLALVLGNESHYEHLEGISIVHVDDVASAHIFLLENPNAKGRYICSNGELSLTELSVFLAAKYPDIAIPSVDSLKDIKGDTKSCKCSSKKLVDTGFKFKHSLDDMFDGAIQSYKEKGFLS